MPKKILVLHSSADLYGSGRVILDSVRVLKEKQFNVFMVLPYRGPLVDELEILGATVIVRNLGALRKKYLNIFGLLNRLIKITSVVGLIRRLIRDHKIDLVYSNTSTVLAGAIAARLEAVPHLHHIHEIPSAPGWYSSLIGKFLNFTSSKVIVVSEAVKNHWVKWVAEEKLIRIYNGMPANWANQPPEKSGSVRAMYGFSDTDIVICTIGRILPLKGHSYLLDIAELMVRQTADVRFLIIGDPFLGYEELYTRLLSRIKETPLKGKVVMPGFKSNIAAILGEADLLVHPSVLPDSLPTVILEAMQMAKPVVATDMGGASELMAAGNTGILIPHDNALKASEMILDLIENKDIMRQMGAMGKKRIDEFFTIQKYNEQLLQTVNSLVKQ